MGVGVVIGSIGVPREIKDQEKRVALTPAGADALVRAGHTVLVEAGAGDGSGFADAQYASVGAHIVAAAPEVWERAALILKVKEPLPAEYGHFRPDHILFTYLHLAGVDPALTRSLLERRVTALAYETLRLPNGRLPLLEPMSAIAGRLAVQIGAHFLEAPAGGRGVLLGGVPGVGRGNVVILGAGSVGRNAAQVAAGMGAHVLVLNRSVDALIDVERQLPCVATEVASPSTVAAAVASADVLIGAVLVVGERAPSVVSREMVAAMRPRAVIVDVAIDQGGCVETIHPTSHTDPTYLECDVVHYAVPNMPGAVPHTSTVALTNATLPYVLQLARLGLDGALQAAPALVEALNVRDGAVVHPAVARALTAPSNKVA
jgi:alanine dehydrogenase